MGSPLSDRWLVIGGLAIWMCFFCISLYSQAEAQHSGLEEGARGGAYESAGSTIQFVETNTQWPKVRQLPDKVWRTVEGRYYSAPMGEHDLWLRFKKRNPEEVTRQWTLLLDYVALDDVTVHLVDEFGETKASYRSGDRLPFLERTLKFTSPAFPVTLPPDREITVWLHVKHEGTLIIPLEWQSQDQFEQFRSNRFLLGGLVVGVLLVTALYNALLFYRIREGVFGRFSAFTVSLLLFWLANSGLGMQFLWPELYAANQFLVLLAIGAAGFFHYGFTRAYLSLTWSLDRIVALFQWAFLLTIPLTLTAPYLFSLKVIMLLVLVSMSTTILAILYMAFGLRRLEARHYLVAWSAFLIGTIVAAATRYQILEYSQWTEQAGLLGSLVTIVWLSVLFSDRMQQEKSARLREQQAAIDNLARYEALYAHSVEGRFTTRLDGSLINCNAAFLRIVQYDSVEDLRNSLANDMRRLYVDPSRRDTWLRMLQKEGKVLDFEVQMLRKDGQPVWVSLTIRPDEGENQGQMIFEGSVLDISARKEGEAKLSYLASHDTLTGLYNRREFETRLNQAIHQLAGGARRHSLILMDLDQFKLVNDTCGHDAGDQLLIELSGIMQEIVGEKGDLARLGGDEFGLLLRDQPQHLAYPLADEVRKAIGRYRFHFDDKVFSVGVSLGMLELKDNNKSREEVMRAVDTACFIAKDLGRNRIHVYSESSNALKQRQSEMSVASSITEALESGRFRLYLQPIVDSSNFERVVAREVLLRLVSPEGEVLPPSRFLAAAQRYGLIHRLDCWVIEETLSVLHENPRLLAQSHFVTINLSEASLGEEGFTEKLLALFRRYPVPFDRICFEVSEAAAIRNLKPANDFIRYFKRLGCLFSLDDFGAGFSAYSPLKNLQVDFVKIRSDFIQGLEQNPVDIAMVQAIHDIAKALNIKTIAAGVERQGSIKTLVHMGVHYLQGYALGEPAPLVIPE